MGMERRARLERKIQRSAMEDFRADQVIFNNWISIARKLERHYRRAVQIVTNIDMSLPNSSSGYNRFQRRQMEAKARSEQKFINKINKNVRTTS